MKIYFWRNIIIISTIGFSLISCCYKPCQNNSSEVVYVSDLKIIHSANVHGGIGIDKPYWMEKLIICGESFTKGLVVHPKDGRRIAYVEFILPRDGGRLLGLAGCAEETGGEYAHKMRFRIFIDGDLLYEKEIDGNECQNLNLDLNQGTVLRIETDDGGDGNYYDHMAFGDLRISYLQ